MKRAPLSRRANVRRFNVRMIGRNYGVNAMADNLSRIAELAAVLASETATQNWNVVARDSAELLRMANRAQSWAEKQCDGIPRYDRGQIVATWTEADEKARERALTKIRDRATAILQPYGANVASLSGDPRGSVMKIQLASNRRNGWGEYWNV